MIDWFDITSDGIISFGMIICFPDCLPLIAIIPSYLSKGWAGGSSSFLLSTFGSCVVGVTISLHSLKILKKGKKKLKEKE